LPAFFCRRGWVKLVYEATPYDRARIPNVDPA